MVGTDNGMYTVGGGGGGGSSMAGYATESWVNENYLSISFFSSLFKAYDSAATPNEIRPNGGTVANITNIKAMFGFWTEQYLSALGQNSGGGGGGGTTLNEPLASINAAGLASHPSASGQTIVWNGSAWVYGNAGGGGGAGTVTSVGMTVPTGFSVSGSPITSSGTLVLGFATGYSLPSDEKQSQWDTAYGWGNHATAGYATPAWVQAQGYLTSVGFADLTSHPTTLAGYGITDALSNSTVFWGQTIHNGVVKGDLSAGASGGKITQFHAIELNDAGSRSGIGGFIDFHFDGSSADYTTRLIESESGVLRLYGKLQIGSAVLEWDSTNSCLKLTGGMYATSFLSALGLNSSGGGGGGGASALYQLVDVKPNNAQNPTAVYGQADGKVLKYSAADGKWLAGDITAGTVTSITAGTGLSGGTITTSGTIAISPDYQTYISHGQTAYGWGNHANAGYATQTWVTNQGYLTPSAITDMATKTWVSANFNNYVHPDNGANKTITAAAGRVLSAISVDMLGHVTSVSSKTLTASDIPSLSAEKITSGTLAFARLPQMYWANVLVSSSSNENTSPTFNTTHVKGIVNGPRGIYFNVLNPSDSHGGVLDFHFAGAENYTTRLIESESGVLRLYGKLQIGSAILEWDNTNSCLKLTGGMYSTSFLSALGLNSSGGGGGGGASALYQLVDVKPNNAQNPTAVYGQADGKVLKYSATEGKWLAGDITSGTVTSITAGTGLSGGTITSSGTIAISSDYQAYISHGQTAYGWGNHATAGYATQAWVTNQGYLTPSAISDMATKTWVNANFNNYIHPENGANKTITAAAGRVLSAISVDMLGHVTSVSSKTLTASDIPNLSAAKITSGTLAFDRLPQMYWANIAVASESSDNKVPTFAEMYTNIIRKVYSIEMNSGGGQAANGGYIDFHFAGSSADYTTRLIEIESGVLMLYGKLRMGDGYIEWDENNHCFKVTGGLYATGFLSALGLNSSGSGNLSVPVLNVTNQLNIIGNGTTHTLVGDAGGNISTESSVYVGSLHTIEGGYVHSSRFYLDDTRYLYLNGSTLMYYNGTTSKQIAFV